MKYIAIAFLFFFAATGNCQWVQTSGPEGVTVVSSAVCPSGVMLSDNSGNYYRYSGTTWVKTGKLPSSGMIQSVGDIIYVTKDQKLQRSDNFGSSWIELPISGKITGSGNTLFCAMTDTLYSSNDAGITWQMNDTLPMFTEYVVSTGSHIVGVVNGFERKIIWSVAGSKVWQDASVPPPADGAMLVDMIADGTSLYALISSGDIFMSTDGGNSWQKAYDPPTDEQDQYIQLAKNGSNIWVRSYSGIYEWNDSSWSKRLSGYFASMSAYADGVTLSNTQGVFRLHNDNDKLEYISTGFKNSSISAIAVIGKTIFTTAHNGVFRSTDLGSSWQSVLPNVQPSDFASTGTHIFSFEGGKGLYRSSDDGITWEIVPTPLDDQWQDGTSIATLGSTLFLVHGKTFGEHGTSRWVDGGVLRSTDNGASWKYSNSGLPSTIESYVPTQQIVNHNGTLYLATVEGFFRSTTGGSSWIPTNQGLEFQNGVKVGALIKGGNSVYCQYYGNMYMLVSDFWVKLPQPDSITYFFGSYGGYAVGVGDSLYAVAYSYDSFAASFIYKTLLFNGTSWSDISSSLPEAVILNNFTRTSGIMLAGSMGHSVWRSGIPNAVTPNEGTSLVSLYPNPADDVLYIDATFNNANITITDLLGKTVLELDGISGKNTINVSSLSSGVYNIQIHADDKTTTSRAIIK
jgi:hypothetical protein